MEFASLLISFANHDENFEQANEQLVELSNTDPNQFIANLLEVISLPEADERLKNIAINLLTVPVQRDKSTFITIISTSNLSPEILESMTSLLIEVMFADGPLAKTASRVLPFFYSDSNPLTRQVFGMLMSYFLDDQGKPLTIPYLEAIKTISAYCVLMQDEKIEQILSFTRYFAEKEATEEEIKLYLEIVKNLLTCIPSTSETEGQLFDVYVFIWSMLGNFPKEVIDCFYMAMLNFPDIINQIPDFVEQILEMVKTEDHGIREQAIRLLVIEPIITTTGEYETFNCITSGREVDLLNLMISYLVEDESQDVVEFGSYLGRCRQAISTLIQHTKENAGQFLEYAFQNIENEVIGNRDAATVLFSHCLSIQTTKEAALENAAQFVMVPLQDPTPRVRILGLYLVQSLSYMKEFTIELPLVQLVVQTVCIDNEAISLDATQCLFAILMQGSNELSLEAAGAIFNHIKEIEDDYVRAELIRNLVVLCEKLPGEVAATILPSAVELAQWTLQESQEIPLISLSPALGFASAIFQKVGKQAPEFVEAFLPLACQLIQGDNQADGVTILNPIVENFGDADPGVVQTALEAISKYLPGITIKESMSPFIELCKVTLPFITEEEPVAFIFNNMLNYSLATESTPEMRSEIAPVLAEIFYKAPDIFASNFVSALNVLFSTFTTGIPIAKLMHIVAVCSQQFTPDEPVFQKVLNNMICLININASSTTFDLEDFAVVIEAMNTLLPENSLVNIAYSYNTYIKSYTPPELDARVSELIQVPQASE